MKKKSYHVVPQPKENNIIHNENNNINMAQSQINRQYPSHVLDTSNTEYYLNRRKNMTSYEDIYKGKEYKMNQKSINDKKLEQQKETLK